jgi:hypothetical protein
LRIFRILAAISPTACLSLPRTTICVGAGTSNSTPSGTGTSTGCENPACTSISLPFMAARYPTPTISSFFSNPFVTPSTMLASSERVRPCRPRLNP